MTTDATLTVRIVDSFPQGWDVIVMTSSSEYIKIPRSMFEGDNPVAKIETGDWSGLAQEAEDEDPILKIARARRQGKTTHEQYRPSRSTEHSKLEEVRLPEGVSRTERSARDEFVRVEEDVVDHTIPMSRAEQIDAAITKMLTLRNHPSLSVDARNGIQDILSHLATFSHAQLIKVSDAFSNDNRKLIANFLASKIPADPSIGPVAQVMPPSLVKFMHGETASEAVTRAAGLPSAPPTEAELMLAAEQAVRERKGTSRSGFDLESLLS